MLHGWIEIGLSNPDIFNGQSNPDIIMRTYDDSNTNKIIIGNTSSNDAPNRLAAMYVLNNNVGFKKMPSNDIDVDINGFLSTTDGRVASNLYVGYGTNQGFMRLRGDLQIINQNTSDLLVVNSNNGVQFLYSNVERVKFTNGSGVYLNDNVYVTNDVYATGYHITSDSNFKENIEPTDPCMDLETLLQLNVCDFNFKSTGDLTKGLIAQNVQSIFPSAVKEVDGIIPIYQGIVYVDGDCLLDDSSDYDTTSWLESIVVGDDLVLGSDNSSREYIVKVTRISLSDKRIHLDKFISLEHESGKIMYMHGKLGKVKTIDPHQVTALCVSAMQELHRRVCMLETRA